MSDHPLALVNQVDQVKAFMLYAYSGGDVERTAAICQVDTRIIQALEHDFLWKQKIKGQNRLDTPEGLKAEQEANRAANYVLARRYEAMLENVILNAETSDRFAETLCVELVPIKGEPGKYDKVFTGKPLLELAKALQVVTDMKYRALGDRVAGTADVNPKDGDRPTNLAVHIYAGLDRMKQALKVAKMNAPTADLETQAMDVLETEKGVLIDAPSPQS